ncbi:MAG: hypothetical protein GY754_01325 [bacterium]|nr:hypothetical protein [bacterium]
MKSKRSVVVIILVICFLQAFGHADKKRVSANYILTIKKLLKANKKVALIIYIPEKSIHLMANPPVTDKQNMPVFKQALSQKIYSGTVRILTGYFPNNKNFSIVNRNNLTRILKEQELSQSGLLEEESRVKVGGLVGANYILSINHTMTLTPAVKAYLTINKLVEIPTGKELSSDEANIVSTQSGGKTVNTYFFNGSEVIMRENKMYKKE